MKRVASCLLTFLGSAAVLGCAAKNAGPELYDVVVHGGRVLNPETDTNTMLNVGITNGRIAALSSSDLKGRQTIDATGRVVAPGFIDLHAHGQNEESLRLMVRDGVTSAFELEGGTEDVARWYAKREPGQLINYGVSVSHVDIRMKVMGDPGERVPVGPAANAPANDAQISRMKALVEKGLDEGAVAVGFGTGYTPAALATSEFETMLGVVAERKTSAHVHIRDGLSGLVETIEAARVTGASLHVVHVNSSGGPQTNAYLQLIEQARARGQDVTTEAYPYEAGMVPIESARFDDWETWDDAHIAKHQWAATGEWLNRESFRRYRQVGGPIIRHTRTEEMTRAAIEHPLTMIASDGSLSNGKGHPRTSGSYAKVLGEYVRKLHALKLEDAVRKMTIEPARRLERYVPAMKRKGRIAVGMDADITIFDPETVSDRATYSDPALPSAGISHVLVNGVVVVSDGELAPEVRAGRAIRRHTSPGR